MLIQEPFPHEVGVGAFPPEMYAEMLKQLPDHSDYVQFDSYPRRYMYKTDNGFWRSVFDYLIAPWGNYKTKVQLLRDLPGYEIGPHTDTIKKLKTYIYYVTDKEVEGAGTSLYKPRLDGFTSKTGAHYDFDAFELVKSVPYVPNGYFSFERTDKSFHGVRKTDIVRNVIQMAVYRREEY